MNYEDRITKAYLENALAGCGNCKIVAGTYTGTGTYGQDNPTSLTFDFQPKFVAVARGTIVLFVRGDAMANAVRGSSLDGVYANKISGGHVLTSWAGNTLSWYAKNAEAQMNSEDYEYSYVAIG